MEIVIKHAENINLYHHVSLNKLFHVYDKHPYSKPGFLREFKYASLCNIWNTPITSTLFTQPHAVLGVGTKYLVNGYEVILHEMEICGIQIQNRKSIHLNTYMQWNVSRFIFYHNFRMANRHGIPKKFWHAVLICDRYIPHFYRISGLTAKVSYFREHAGPLPSDTYAQIQLLNMSFIQNRNFTWRSDQSKMYHI